MKRGLEKLKSLAKNNYKILVGAGVATIVLLPIGVYAYHSNSNKPNFVKVFGNQTDNKKATSQNNTPTGTSTTTNTNTTNPTSGTNKTTKTGTTSTTNGGSTSTSTNTTGNNSNSNSTPAPTPTPTPTPHYVDWWDLSITAVSPTSCGSEYNKCPLGTTMSVTTHFAERATGKLITITSCTAYGTLSAGPVSSYPDPIHIYATASMPDNKTCIANFRPPTYGLFGIWIEATTDESLTHPSFANNTRYVWINP